MNSDGVLVLRVARGKIVEAARSAIANARMRPGVKISPVEARRLLRVARTAPEFALGGWYVAGRCGCLVGNLLGGFDQPDGVRWVKQRGMGHALYKVGLAFDTGIRGLLTGRQLALIDTHLDFAIANRSESDGDIVLRVVDR